MSERVVITGMGIVAPNAHGLDTFERMLRNGESGLTYQESLAEHKFGCRVAGIPKLGRRADETYFTNGDRYAEFSPIRYAVIAAKDAWSDAGLPAAPKGGVLPDAGAIVGTGFGGVDTIAESVVPMTDARRVRRLSEDTVENIMTLSLIHI